MIVLGVLILFLAVILIRTAKFQPKAQPELSTEAVEFDHEKAIASLAELIKCKTISYSDPALEDDAEFDRVADLFSQKAEDYDVELG